MLKLLNTIIALTLYRIGGWKYKFVRRFILPIFLYLISNNYHFKFNLSLVGGAILILGFSLGYGQSRSYLWKFMVGCIWGVALMFLNIFSIKSIIMGSILPVMWILLFWLSNNKTTEYIFKWAYVEIIIGAYYGLSC